MRDEITALKNGNETKWKGIPISMEVSLSCIKTIESKLASEIVNSCFCFSALGKHLDHDADLYT